MSTTQTSTTSDSVIEERPRTITEANESLFQLTAVGGLVAPPMVLPVIHLLLLYNREIPFWDCFFSIAYPIYLCFANRFRFDSNARQIALRKSRGESYPTKPEFLNFVIGEPWFPKYMVFAAGLGVFLPLAIQVLAPPQIANAAAPHLYMLVCQIMMEIMVNGPEFHPLLQLMVPLGFSAYRVSCLKSWVMMAWELSAGSTATTTTTTVAWEVMHMALAVFNTIFWTYNTFVLLPLRVVPHCVDKNRFPDASNVSWNHMIPSVSNERHLQKDKARLG